MQTHTPSLSAFRQVAHAAHARLVEGLYDLAHSAGAQEQRAAWQVLEAVLLDHLRWEGELLLPEFALVCSDEAVRIREEHQRICQLVARLSERSPRAWLDLALLTELRRRVSECGALEERLLYPWAEQCLQPRKKGEFQQRSQVHALLGPAPRAIRVAS